MNELLDDLTDIFPPIEVGLPTRGIFYPEHTVLAPGVDPLRISVRTLGILDEFKYRDPFMLISGKAINHLIRHICGDQILMPEEMCEIDIETILLASRLASYGPDLRVKHTCTHSVDPEAPEGSETLPADIEKVACQHLNTVHIDLREFILRYGPIEDEDKFEVKLPRVGQTVFLKPMLYRTAIEVMRNVMRNRKQLEEFNTQDAFAIEPGQFTKYEEMVDLSADLQIQSLLDCIYAVRTRSGKMVEDSQSIGAWIFELPKSDHDAIHKRVSELGEDFRKISLLRYRCGKCQNENAFNLQMNAEILFLADSEDSAIQQPISSESSEKSRNMLRRPSRILRK